MSFTCPTCGAVSHNPNDERERYCGRCHAFIEPHTLPTLNKGDTVRLRRLGSSDRWCVCRVELLSANKLSAGMTVLDGALYSRDGSMLTGFIPVMFTATEAHSVFTGDELEMEVYQP